MSALAVQANVVVLDDAELNLLIEAARSSNTPDDPAPAQLGDLADRLQFGPDYRNALDELIALDDRKRALAAATRANDARIVELKEQLDAEWTDRGITSERHADSGRLAHRTRGRVYAKVVRAGEETRPEERQAACDALKADDRTAVFVREDFNAASLGAWVKEQAEAYDEQQRELPRDQRAPRDIGDFLPATCAGYVEVTDNPTISLRG